MKNTRYKGVNEIKVRLLPEKAKRDYVLRLVSFIIVLTFIIINILFVYIPYTNYNSELNDLKSKNAAKELESLYLQNKYHFFYQDIFNNNETTIKDIMNSTIDFNQVLLMFDNNATYIDVHQNLGINDLLNQQNKLKLMPNHSIVQSIQYDESKLMFTVVIQFDTINKLNIYTNNIKRVKYVTNVQVGSYTIVQTDGANPVKTTFQITIDPTNEYCPKVGGSIE